MHRPRPRRPSWPVLPLLTAAITTLFTPAGVTAAMVHKDYGVRQVEKVFVTTHLNLLGRAQTSTCPTSYSLCPASVGGGCCPSHYSCATDSCVQTTAPAVTACGRLGYFGCGLDVGGGCCPTGYICGANDCTAPVGVSQSYQCPTDYQLCPASYNYGCCKTNMACGPNACYATTPSTIVFTATFTTTTGSTGRGAVTTVTSTTVETPTVPSGLPKSSSNGVLPKYLPSTQPKVSAVASKDDSSSSGLTKAQIGGLIGGLVVLLIVVLVSAFVIVRRLQKTASIVASRGGSSSATSSGKSAGGPNNGGGNGGRSGRGARQMAQVHQPTPSQIDRMEYDDLLERTSRRGASTRGHTPSASGTSSMHDLGIAQHSGSSRNVRAASMSSDIHAQAKVSSDMSTVGAPGGVSAGGSLDIPSRVQNRPGRRSVSTDARTSSDSGSRRGSAAWLNFSRMRHESNASELSDTSNIRTGTEAQPAELDIEGGFIPELPSASPGASTVSPMLGGQSESDRKGKGRSFSASSVASAHQQKRSMDLSHSRTRSNSSNSAISFTPSHNRDRSGSSASYQQGQPQHQRLDSVSEAVEHLHGHYGPTNVAAGQTRAGVNVNFDVSSPTVP